MPACAITFCPAQAVTPVASSESLTMNSDAMKMTVGSPKPARASGSASTPVKYSASETPMATTPSGMRLLTKATTARARMPSVATTGSMRDP